MINIPYRHSLSSNYQINSCDELDINNMLIFDLSDGNKIYINQNDLIHYYGLKQDIYHVRDEVKTMIIDELNEKFSFEKCKVISLNEKTEGDEIKGFSLPNAFLETYIYEVDVNLGNAYFPIRNESFHSEIDLSQLMLDIHLQLGTIAIPLKHALKKNEIYILKSNFQGKVQSGVVFDYLLGLDEILLISKGFTMSLETAVGEPLIPDPSGINIELDVSLGSLTMSLSQLQSLVVGDFIQLKDLSINQIELKMKNTLVAYGELVYDENKQLSVAVKEVFI